MSVANLQAYALSQGITESWQSMSQAEQVMLRYNYLMQASAQQQGDFARTSMTWANQVRLLQLNIQQLAATIGQGLIAAVLPAVQALNKLFAVLQKAAVAVRNFFYVLTGYKGGGSSGIVNDLASIGDASTGLEDLGSSGSDAADGLGDAAKAAEELKNATLGIDELNIISPNEPTSTGGTGGSGGGGGSGGVGGTDLGLDDGLLDLGGKDPEEYVSPWAEAIRKAFLAEDWEELGSVIAGGLNRGLQKVYDVISWDNVGPKITAFTTAFTETFNSLVDSFDWDLLGRTIGAGINTVVNTLNQLIEGIDWVNLGVKIATGINGLLDEVDWFELGRLIGNEFMIAWDTLLGIVTTLDWGEVGRSLADGFNGMLSEISLGDIGTTIGTIVAGVIEMFREFFANAEWGEVVNQIKEGLGNAISSASNDGENNGILAVMFGTVGIAGLSKVIPTITPIIEKIKGLLGKSGVAGSATESSGAIAKLGKAFSKLKIFIGGISAPVGIAIGAITLIVAGIVDLWNTSETFRDNVSDTWDKIADAFVYAKQRIWDDGIKPLWDSIGEFFGSIYDMYEESGMKDVFELIATTVIDTIGGNLSMIIEGVSNAFSTVASVASDLIGILTGIIEFVSGVFSGDWRKAWSGVEKIVDNVVQAIEDFFGGLWEEITIIFSPVIDFFEENFSGAYEGIKNIWKSVNMWFQEKWNAIKKVFNPTPETFKAWFSNAYNNVKNIWTNVATWFQGKWTAIKNVFSPVAQTFRTWFSNAYTNVKNVWNSVNTWFQGKWSEVKTVFNPTASTFKGWFLNAYNNVKNIWNSVNTWFQGKWTAVKTVFGDVQSFFKNGFQKAYDAVKNIWNGLSGLFKSIANNAFKPIKTLVNGVIKGVNWVLDKVGSNKRVSEWGGVKFAKGSNGIPQNTLGVVNDQKGATYKELIVPPNGKPFIPKGRNVMLPLQKGTKIMPANQTKELMKSLKIPKFAGGIGDFFGSAWNAVKNFTGDVFDYLTNPKDIVKIAIDKFASLSEFVEPWLSVAGGMVNTVLSRIVDFIKDIFDGIVPKVEYNPSEGVEQWRSLAKYALQLEGQYTEANLDRLLMQMQTESSGNPNAINNWDSNAKRGTPSKGLMQVIDPTFRSYARPGYSSNIYDPLSNILASIRYTVSRYGSLANGWKGHGYASGVGTINLSDLFGAIPKLANGGLVMPGQLFVANERGPELIGRYGNKTAVIPNDQVVTSVSSGVEKAVERQNAEMTLLLRQILETNQRILAKDNSTNIDGKRANQLLDRARRNSGYTFRRTVNAT